MTTDAESLAQVDDLFTSFHGSGRAPGVVWGVISGGRMVHFGAAGVSAFAADPDPAPDRVPELSPDSVFRIASMTKSFTASAVLLLRDRRQLSLDDLVADYVPELRDLVRPTADAPPLSIRHLLTMSGGLPTDDPWGDRNESLQPDQFSELLSKGFSFVDSPGVGYEYSNLGWAILGRVIEAATSATNVTFREFIAAELLTPLGMTSTAYDATTLDPWIRVPGHVKTETGWQIEPVVGPGAFSAMGGLHSSVSDLVRWVTGFLDAYPARDDPAGSHPLSRASRRDMQQLHQFREVTTSLRMPGPDSGAQPVASSSGYGFGLMVEHFTDHGHVVHHSGGYPGYGSHMRWHPATGIGVVTLSNGTYAGGSQPAREALRLLVTGANAHRRPAWPATVRAAERVSSLLSGYGRNGDFSASAATGLFTNNVELDVPTGERLAQLARAVSKIGALPETAAPGIRSQGPAQAAWSIPAAGGRLDVEILMSPEPAPRIQSLQVDGVPAAPARLRSLAERLVQSITDGGAGWPALVPAAASLDRRAFEQAAVIARSFATPRAGGGYLAELLEAPVRGDGEDQATFAVLAGDTWWALSLSTQPVDETSADVHVTKCSLVPFPEAVRPHLEQLRRL